MSTEARPWRLDVAEPSIIDRSWAWETWSTYRTEENARDRAERLTSKGYVVRVVHEGDVDGPEPAPCGFCDGIDHHEGECLI